MIFPIYTYPLIYLITIVIGLINFKKFKHNTYLKLFFYFLIYSFISEISGAYVGRVLVEKNNFIYNTWNIFNLAVTSIVFLSKIKKPIKRKIVISLLTFFALFTFINIIFYSNYYHELLLYNILLAKLIIVFVLILYFSEVLVSNEILYVKYTLFYWIALGIFLYNLTFLPSYALFKFITVFGIFQIVILVLNLVMHACFITGFLISKKEYNN